MKKGRAVSKLVQFIFTILWFSVSLWFILKNVNAGDLIMWRYFSEDYDFGTYVLVGGGLQALVSILAMWGVLSIFFFPGVFNKGFAIIGILASFIPTVYLIVKWSQLAWGDFAELTLIAKILLAVVVFMIWLIGILVCALPAAPTIALLKLDLLDEKFNMYKLMLVSLIFALALAILAIIVAGIAFFITRGLPKYQETINWVILILCLIGGGGGTTVYYFIVKNK